MTPTPDERWTVVFTSDVDYLMPTAVALTSLLAVHPRQPLDVHLIVDATTEVFQAVLSDLFGGAPHRSCVLHRAPELKGRVSGLATRYHITRATYYRFFIPEFVGSGVRRVLYLDGDVLVRRPLDELFRIPIDPFPVAAVHEPPGAGPSSGFNAGVLLLDLPAWRSERLGEALLRYAERNAGAVRWPSQEPLNVLLRDRWTPLADVYNHGEALRRTRSGGDPAIVHFRGSEKPWQCATLHPFQGEFRRVLRATRYAGYRAPDCTPAVRVRRALRRIRRFLGRRSP